MDKASASGSGKGDVHDKTCVRCGREGKIAYRRIVQRVGKVDVPLWMCSNVGACGLRQARGRWGDTGRIMGVVVAARRASLAEGPCAP